MSSKYRRPISRRRVLAGAAAAAVAGRVSTLHARPTPTRGGHERGGGGGAGLITTFSLSEHTGISSVGFKRGGICLPGGLASSAGSLAIQRISDGTTVDADFNALSSRWDGPFWQFVTFCLRDSAFAPNETRNYQVVFQAGSFDRTPRITLSAALAGTDFKVKFTNVSGVGITNGPRNNLTASLNTHAAVSTRTTSYERGKVCCSWRIWGMAADDVTGLEDPHLKVVWHISAWLNADGSLADLEIMPVLCLNWWSVTNKEKINYDAAFMNGATTIVSYTGVEHCYMMTWAMVRQNNDNEHATRPWLSGNNPTLLYKPNINDWIASNLVPPQNRAPAFVMPAYLNTYVPGSSFSHQAAMEATGAYMGRGLLPNACTIAFLNPTAANIRTARVNWFAGLHCPIHRRSDRTRTRPGDSGVSDIADTAVANIIWDARGPSTPSAFYTFTADGLPTPVHAYSTNTTSASFRDSYAFPTGGTTSGSTAWTLTENDAHASAFCYFGYLYSGEYYFWDATIDHGMDSFQGFIGGAQQAMPANQYWNVFGSPQYAWYPGATSTQWAANMMRSQPTNDVRAAAWAANMEGCLVVVPDEDVHVNYFKTLLPVAAQYLKAAADLIPASGVGSWGPGKGICVPWMQHFCVMAFCSNYLRTGDVTWRAAADYLVKLPLMVYNNNLLGTLMTFHLVTRPAHQPDWNASTNDWFQDNIYPLTDNVTISAATDIVTMGLPNTMNVLNLVNGDRLVFCDTEDNQDVASNRVPTEITLGTVYYAANVTNNVGPAGTSTLQISRNQSGTDIVDFLSDYTKNTGGKGVPMGVLIAAAGNRANWPILTNPDSYGMIATGAINLAKRAGCPGVTQAVVNAFNAYWATARADTSWANWNLLSSA